MRVPKSLLVAVAAVLLLCSCSDSKKQEEEKGKIEAMTEQMGKDAVQAIKTPMEKAQAAADAASEKAKEANERRQE